MAHQPTMGNIAFAIPKPIARRLSRETAAILGLADEGFRSMPAYRTCSRKWNHAVIFDGLQHVLDDQAAAEAVDILAAGSDTTAFLLTTAIHNILVNPEIKRKFPADLRLDTSVVSEGLDKEQHCLYLIWRELYAVVQCSLQGLGSSKPKLLLSTPNRFRKDPGFQLYRVENYTEKKIPRTLYSIRKYPN
jgi:hypothetical protein